MSTERQVLYRDRGCKYLTQRPDKGITSLDAGGVCVLLIKRDPPIIKGVSICRTACITRSCSGSTNSQLRSRLACQGVECFEEDRCGGTIDGPRAYFRDPTDGLGTHQPHSLLRSKVAACRRSTSATMMKLGMFLEGTGHHVAAWRDPDVDPHGRQSLQHYSTLRGWPNAAGSICCSWRTPTPRSALTMWNRGRDDGGLSARADYTACAIAAVTERIGLVATATTT